jgi:hypothetical protein
MVGRRAGRIGVVARLAVVVLLAGCGPAGVAGTGGGGGGAEGLDRQRQQARDALSRYDAAFAAATPEQRFVPVGELTGQVGNWEPDNYQNKTALDTGRLQPAAPLPAAPQPTASVVWDSGATLTVPLISADEALRQLAASAAECGGCPTPAPLEVTAARLSTVKVQTTRGPATVPAWEYTLRGTAVRVTRVAVAGSATTTISPPPWDANNPPAGLQIESATTSTGSRQLTVAFTGAPGPASSPCGIDYTGEAVESPRAVVVIIIEHPHTPGGACLAIGARRTAVIELAAPLGERAVLEVRQGLPVPVTITS